MTMTGPLPRTGIRILPAHAVNDLLEQENE